MFLELGDESISQYHPAITDGGAGIDARRGSGMNWRRAGRGWLMAAALVALLLGGWWLWLRPGQMKARAVRAQAESTLAQGATRSAEAALRASEKVRDDETDIHGRLDAGNAAIAAAEGGEQALPPAVAAATLRGLCLHAAYRGDPRCAAMQ